MNTEGVLDTSVVILLDRIDPSAIPDQAVVTAITMAELSVGPLVTDDPVERATRQVRLQQVAATLEAFPFDKAAAQAYGGIAASLHRAGRKASARAFDALIAATAMSRGLPVYTCNPRDFDSVEGLEVVAVPHPDA